jgi:hypothetical protein
MLKVFGRNLDVLETVSISGQVSKLNYTPLGIDEQWTN